MTNYTEKALFALKAALLTLLLMPSQANAQPVPTDNVPGKVDPDYYQLRMWLRADKPEETMTRGQLTPDRIGEYGEVPKVNNTGSLRYYNPFKAEEAPTEPHYTVLEWRDWAGVGDGIAGHGLGLASVPPYSTTGTIAAHRGTVWMFDNQHNTTANPQRQLVPVWLPEHALSNYHPAVYFWYNSPDGNYKGNDEQGAYLNTKDNIVPYMQVANSAYPLNGEHTAFFVINTPFPNDSKRTFIMGFNGRYQMNMTNGPSWGTFRLDPRGTYGRSDNVDNGLMTGRMRVLGPGDTGYDNDADPGLVAKNATAIAGYQTIDETGSPTDYNRITLDFIFNGSTLHTGNQDVGNNGGHDWGGTPSRDGSLGTAHDRFLGGILCEVILYEKKLQPADLKKVNSYLAFKYGITLSNNEVYKDDGVRAGFVPGSAMTGYNDYILSDNAVAWNGTQAGNYQTFYHNLAALVRDDGSLLNNQQSHSTDAGSIIRMGIAGTHLGDSIANLGSYPNNGQYLMWGNDGPANLSKGYNLNNYPLTCPVGTGYINKLWMVHKRNDGIFNNLQFPTLISAQNNSYLFDEITDFNYGPETDVYLCIAKTLADAQTGNWATIIKAEYLDGEHQFQYTFSQEFTWFALAVGNHSTAGCYGEALTSTKYLNFRDYQRGGVYTPYIFNSSFTENLTAATTVTYDAAVKRPNTSRFPYGHKKEGFLRITRTEGSATPSLNQVTTKITTSAPVLPQFVISSVNRRHQTYDIVKVYGKCDGGLEIPARLDYNSNPTTSRYVIEGNTARANKPGLAGRRNPLGQLTASFSTGVREVYVEYTASGALNRNHIDIFPVSLRSVPLPPPVSKGGVSFTKEANRDEVSACETIIYTFRAKNHIQSGDLTNATLTDTLPAGLHFLPGSIVFDDVNNANASVSVQVLSSGGTNNVLRISGLTIPDYCPDGQNEMTVRATVTIDDFSTPAQKTFYNRGFLEYYSTATSATEKQGSVDYFTQASQTAVVVNEGVELKPVLVSQFVSSKTSYRELDTIKLDFTLNNPNSTALTGLEFELDFDAGFRYIAGSYTGAGTVNPAYPASDSTFFITNFSVPTGVSTFSLKIVGPSKAILDLDEFGAPIQTGPNKFKKADLEIDFEVFSNSSDPCYLAALDSLYGEKIIPYRTEPYFIVVNREINHTFSPEKFAVGFMPGMLLTADQYICPGSTPAPIAYSSSFGGTSPITYLWQYSASPTGPWSNAPGVNNGLYYTPPSTLAQGNHYFRRAVTDATSQTVYGAASLVTVGDAVTSPSTDQNVSVASDSTFTYTAPAMATGTQYIWVADSATASVSGNISGTGAAVVGTLNNYSSTASGKAYYTVTPYRGGCYGNPFRLIVTVAPCIVEPLQDTYKIDACVGAMYTYQFQKITVYDASTSPLDAGQRPDYKWEESYSLDDGANWSAWTNLNTNDVTYTIPAYRFNTTGTTPTVSTNTQIRAKYRCTLSNSLNSVQSSELQIHFIHLGDYATIRAIADANGGLIPVPLSYQTGQSLHSVDTIWVAHANLGAELDSLNNGAANDACDLGDLFQWGRVRDGHSYVDWIKNTTTQEMIYNYASTPINRTALSASDYDPTTFQVLPTSDAYGRFIYQYDAGAGAERWTNLSSNMKNLWIDRKTAADPCPEGWIVPSATQIAKLYDSHPTVQVNPLTSPTSNVWREIPFVTTGQTVGGGYIIRNATNPQHRLFIPAAGVRNGQPLASQNGGDQTPHSVAGAQGRYWTSTDWINTTTSPAHFTENSQWDYLYGYNFLFGHDAATPLVNIHEWTGTANEGYPKLDGRSVRCVKEKYEHCSIPTCDATSFENDVTRKVKIPTIYGDGDSITFLTYNLGACPTMTPKEQMAYLSTYSKTAEDAMVYGGLFQWGRKDYESALRCSPASTPSRYTNNRYSTSNYNPSNTSQMRFVWGAYNWLTYTNDTDYNYFWGNGDSLDDQINTKYEGDDNKYNPCPTGFRIPTQNEWASIGIENADYKDIFDDGFPVALPVAHPNNGVGHSNPYLYWVPVVNGRVSQAWETGGYLEINNPKMTGYAIYATADWAAVSASGKAGTTPLYADLEPEPLMFLPAAGFRNGMGNGTSAEPLWDAGYSGSYWSSTFAYSNYSYALWFDHQNVSATGMSTGGHCISSGRSVRCIEDCPKPDVGEHTWAESGTRGKDFYIAFGLNFEHYTVDDVDLQLKIVTDTATTVTIHYTDGSLPDKIISIPANTVYSYILTDAEKSACYTITTTLDAPKSLGITTDKMVTIYALSTKNHSADASLVLPVRVWGQDYYHLGYTENNPKPDAFIVIAKEAGTEVYRDGAYVTTLSQAGNIYYQTLGTGGDPSGSRITTNKPVGYVSAHICDYIPTGYSFCDILYEYLFPVRTYGRTFFVPSTVQTKARARVLAAHEQTTVTLHTSDAQFVTTIGGQYSASNTIVLDKGQWAEIEFIQNGCHLEANRPVAVTAYLISDTYNDGRSWQDNGNGDGDPAMAWIPPLEQKDRNILMSWFKSNMSVADARHFALLVTKTDYKNLTTIDGAIVSNGTSYNSGAAVAGSWKDSGHGLSFISIELFSNDTHHFDNPDGLVVLGYQIGSAESYYYTAGTSARILSLVACNPYPVNNIEVPILDACGSPITDHGWEIEDYPDSDNYIPLPFSSNLTLGDDLKHLRYFAQNACGKTYSNPVLLLLTDACLAAQVNSAAISASVNVMYDFQSQTLEAYHTSGGAPTDWFWEVSADNVVFNTIPGSPNDHLYTISKDFAKSYSDPWNTYSDTLYFRCRMRNSYNPAAAYVTSNVIEMLFINTTDSNGDDLPGYGTDDNGVKYISLRRHDGTSSWFDQQIALLNLGQGTPNAAWNATSFTNSSAEDLGDFYQWGRVADGHQKTVWSQDPVNHDHTISPMDGILTSLAVDFKINTAPTYNAINHQVASGFYYGKFIYTVNDTPVNGENDWYYNSGSHDNALWGYSGFTPPRSSTNPDPTFDDWNYPSNNPCPTGWSVPSRWNFWDVFKGDGATDVPTTESPYAGANNDWEWRPTQNFALGGAIITNPSTGAKVFLPAMGYRDNQAASLICGYNTFSEGRYWTSTYATTNESSALRFSPNGVRAAGSDAAYYRSSGFPVRCVKEYDPDICRESSTKGTEFYAAFGKNTNLTSTNVYLAVDIAADVASNVTFTNVLDNTVQTVAIPANSVYRYEPDASKVYDSSGNYTLKITSNHPISVYAFSTGVSTTDATVVLPTSAWGNEYYMFDYMPQGYCQQLIIAKENNTTVTTYTSAGVAETPFTLQAGEIRINTFALGEDQTGRRISANKPIGVFANNSNVKIPSTIYYDDILFEQMLSVDRWGKRFLVPNAKQSGNTHNNRIRILASENGTTVTYSGAAKPTLDYPANSTDIPSGGTLNQGQFVELEITSNVGDCFISTDKPVAVCAYLTGEGSATEWGDPSMAWISPIEQMLTDVLFKPFMFPISTAPGGVAYTNFDGVNGASDVPVHHYAIVITPTYGKSQTTVNGTPIASAWTETWTDDASAGYSFYIHEFNNTTDLNRDFKISNPNGVLILVYGITQQESYYYNAASGACVRN